jgi:hypothetical protein
MTRTSISIGELTIAEAVARASNNKLVQIRVRCPFCKKCHAKWKGFIDCANEATAELIADIWKQEALRFPREIIPHMKWSGIKTFSGAPQEAHDIVAKYAQQLQTWRSKTGVLVAQSARSRNSVLVTGAGVRPGCFAVVGPRVQHVSETSVCTFHYANEPKSRQRRVFFDEVYQLRDGVVYRKNLGGVPYVTCPAYDEITDPEQLVEIDVVGSKKFRKFKSAVPMNIEGWSWPISP